MAGRQGMLLPLSWLLSSSCVSPPLLLWVQVGAKQAAKRAAKEAAVESAKSGGGKGKGGKGKPQQKVRARDEIVPCKS